jgi:hypothetical protein
MPVNVTPFPALPHCGGDQWSVGDLGTLVHLTALVLLGRSHHAAEILSGAERDAPVLSTGLKAEIQRELFPASQGAIYHRDGLLFEVICWLAARIGASPNEVLSDPHLKATTQGTDAVKVTFDEANRVLARATVYEYKCTTNSRDTFRGEVLPAFREYVSGKRDHSVSQAAITLLTRFQLTPDEQKRAQNTLIRLRPFAFQAALTVEPADFPTPACVALFKGFDSIVPDIGLREGHTFPLQNVRQWFATFTHLVWAEIETFDV